MEIKKKLIKETVGDYSKEKNIMSNKKQNIIITEKQLEKILSNIQKQK
jgi:hypothetical protein